MTSDPATKPQTPELPYETDPETAPEPQAETQTAQPQEQNPQLPAAPQPEQAALLPLGPDTGVTIKAEIVIMLGSIPVRTGMSQVLDNQLTPENLPALLEDITSALRTAVLDTTCRRLDVAIARLRSSLPANDQPTTTSLGDSRGPRPFLTRREP